MTTQTSFGQWLKQRRKALDLTREDLAGRIGCAIVTITKIEADQRRPSKQIAELLAEHLNIPSNERAVFVHFARGAEGEGAAPWGTPFHPPTNFRPQPTLLIGRERDVAALRKRLLQPESRLLTLIGPPGVGKTRLSLEAAAGVLENFAHGVFFVALAPITDSSRVPVTIASILGVPNVGPRTPLERLQAFLQDKEMLLVLDNFEQILSAAPQIAELLSTCQALKLLVTSRSPLRIRQERQIPVSPLTVPDVAHLPDVEGMTRYSAVTLFMERAQAVKSDFALTQENAPTVATLCARLDGLPLAIELISARVKLLSPVALLERLTGRLMLQSDGLHDMEPRHRTLNAAIDWSYQLLPTDEQALFRRLGVFVGGWTLEAAEAICLRDLSLNLLDGTASLLDKNLVKYDTKSDGEPRFTMLETIREYALERLAETGEMEALQRQHANHFLMFAEATAPVLVGGAQQGQWWIRLEKEHANFRTALTRSRTNLGDATGLRLAVALGEYWAHRGHLSEGSDWLTATLSEEGVSPQSSGKAYRTLRAKALGWLALFAVWRGDLDSAQQYYEESLVLLRKLEDRVALADALSTYGMTFVVSGDYEQARTRLEESLSLSRQIDNADLIAQCLLFLGNLAYSQNNIQSAEALWQESLVLLRAQGNSWLIATLLASLAMVEVDQGDYGQASAHIVESLTRLREMDERWQIIHTLEVFASLAAMEGRKSVDTQPVLLLSARIFGAAEVFRQTFSAPALPFLRHFNERAVAVLRAQLDESTFAAAWAEGCTMTLEQAIEFALSEW